MVIFKIPNSWAAGKKKSSCKQQQVRADDNTGVKTCKKELEHSELII